MPTAFSTINDADVARFTAIASEWWDERGKFAPLHRLNPARIGYIRDHVAQHFGRSTDTTTPLNGLSLLDVGCGGGLISEPMARLGAVVTGIDAGDENVQVASTHANASDLAIDYRCTTAEALAFLQPSEMHTDDTTHSVAPSPLRGGSGRGVADSPQPHVTPPHLASPARGEGLPSQPHGGQPNQPSQFDVVLALEIIEHVANPSLFYDALAALVKPGGLLILSTLNRTAKSYLMAIIGAEYVLRWLPRGTHDWKQFIKPSEMAAELTRRRFTLVDTSGLVFHPLRNAFAINPRDLDVNYLMVAKRP